MTIPARPAAHLAPARATLGEGPVWVEGQRALWFVDIKRPSVHRFRPDVGRLDTWPAPDQIGWIYPVADGRFLVGLAKQLAVFDPAGGRFEPYLAIEPDQPGNRLNDAGCDRLGAIWFGTMDDAEAAPTGRVYRFYRGRVRESRIAPVAITNGPAISPDGRTLYVVDTLRRRILAHAIDDSGEVGDARLYQVFDASFGYPDGIVTDAEGGVWVAFWGGGFARRFAADGRLTEAVSFPVANITKVALGGPDGRTAYVTTARKGLGRAELATQPLAGDLFTFEVETPGWSAACAELGATALPGLLSDDHLDSGGDERGAR